MQNITAEITDMNNLGMGVTRINGKVTFVQHAVDGDIVELKIIKSLSDYNIARIERIISSSPHRIQSKCSVCKRCGGCTFGNITYSHELDLKKKSVETVFRKAGFNNIKISDVYNTGMEYHYRNKLQMPIGYNKNGIITSGFYAKHSHDIIECNDCMLQSHAFDGIVKEICNFSQEHNWNSLRHIFLRTGTTANGTNNVAVCLIVKEKPENTKELCKRLKDGFPHISSIMLNYNRKETNVILGENYELLFGDNYITDNLCGLDFRISPSSFYQVNHDAAELAYNTVYKLAAPRDGDSILDLFCGIGSIGLSVASHAAGIMLTGVEIIDSAVKNAIFNAKSNNISNAEFICGDASSFPSKTYDIIIIDPPRKGCSRRVIESIVKLNAEKIVYMSCEPATLARDINLFAQMGYTLSSEIIPIDMFPRTSHVECVMLMSKTK